MSDWMYSICGWTSGSDSHGDENGDLSMFMVNVLYSTTTESYTFVCTYRYAAMPIDWIIFIECQTAMHTISI